MHAPGRFDNLRRIRSLDPEVDHDEILRLTARFEFPWDYVQGTGVAFLRDYGVPTIAELLDRTREFEDHGVKRYDDTILIGDEATLDGIDSPRSHAALRRLNRIHGHYDIAAEDFAYVLATTIVGPVRWIEAYGWRPLDPHELAAITKVTTRFGELMGLKGLPTTYEGYLALLVDHERRHFAHTPAATRLADASIRIAKEVAPPPLRPLLRRVTIAVMDEPLREALGLPRQARWFARAVRGGLRLRGRLLRFAPPRRTAYVHRPTTYPHGHRLEDLGPLSMLDELNQGSRGGERVRGTMTDRSPQSLTGALPGALLAAAAALTGLLRRDKALHPVGHRGTGRLTVTDPAPALGIEAFSRAGTRPCRARWSRAMGLPQGWPDIEGLALRLEGEATDGGDADLLFAGTGDRAWSRYVLTMSAPGRFGRLTTLLPARAGGRAVTFRLSPQSEPRDGLPPATYALDLALGTGDWQPVGRIDVTWVEADTGDRFDPITHPLAGIEQYAFVTALREPAYVAARAVARARPTTGARHHA